MTKAGSETRKLGKWLYEHCANHGLPFDVYYHHGYKGKDPHVASPQGFYGGKASTLTNLAIVDVVVGTNDGKAKLIVEIEEHSASPKKVIGNILAIMMCNAFKACGRNYHVNEDTSLILACWFTEKGRGREKAEHLFNRIKEWGGFRGGVAIRNVHLILENNLSDLIARTKDTVLELLVM